MLFFLFKLQWNFGVQKLHEIIEVEKESKGVSVSVALLWSNVNYQENLISFTNNIRTTEGGTHVDGLKNVLAY